jgi:hypothetical protein
MTTALTRMLPLSLALSPAKFPNLPSVSIKGATACGLRVLRFARATPDSALAARPQASELADSGAHADAAQP